MCFSLHRDLFTKHVVRTKIKFVWYVYWYKNRLVLSFCNSMLNISCTWPLIWIHPTLNFYLFEHRLYNTLLKHVMSGLIFRVVKTPIFNASCWYLSIRLNCHIIKIVLQNLRHCKVSRKPFHYLVVLRRLRKYWHFIVL